MKKLLTLSFIIHLTIVSYAQLTDDFSDGDFTTNPIWSGSVSQFVVNTSKQLQLNNTIGGTSYLSSVFASPNLNNYEWDIYVKQGFSPSNMNYGRIYLVSDQANLTQSLNGYYLQFGESGSNDAIELFRQAGITSTSVCRATNGKISSAFMVRVKVTRDNIGTWRLLADYTGGTNFTLESSHVDNTYNSSSFMGVVCTYTSGNSTKFIYDDFYAGPLQADTTPPTLQSIAVNSSTQLQLVFSEVLDKPSAETLTNYSASNSIGNPQTAVLQADNKTVILTFQQSFPNGIQNQLTISNVQDVSNNTIASTNQNFLFFIPSPTSSKDIVINEFFPDPSPTIGLPNQEFVEIYNRSNNPIDLNGWKLTDRSSVATFPTQIILPKEYWIVTASTAIASYTPFGKTIGVTNFPTLNNGGDRIILLDPGNNTIDSVSYNLNWYNDSDKQQGGWTLETFNPDVLTYDSSNWSSSLDLSGGTPGKQNSLFGKNPDSTPPKLLSVSVMQQNTLELSFNEKIDPASTTILSNYSTIHNGTPTTASLDITQKIITLSFANDFGNGVRDTLTVIGIKDLATNQMLITNKPILYFAASPVNRKDIIITELMVDPSPPVSLPEAEYIEIYNRSANPIDVTNWKITGGNSNGKIPSRIILPNEYWILSSTSSTSDFSSYGNNMRVVSFPPLNNSGEALILKEGKGVVIDSINYSLDWYHDTDKQDGGWSLELIDPQNTCGAENNWAASENISGGTPGKQNSVFANKPDLTGPKLLTVSVVSSNQLLLTFDEILERDLSSTSFVIAPDAGNVTASFNNSQLREIKLDLSGSLPLRQLYSIQVKNITDCNGNVIQDKASQLQFAVPEIADSLDILVNEILFNPRPNGVDFVELYNNSSKYVNLKDWKFANIENDTIKNGKSITSYDYILPPSDYIAFTLNPSIILNQYPQAKENNLFKTTLPGMNNDQGSIAIITNQNKVIDAFAYTEKYHSPLINDDEGVSLERISFTKPTNDPANWKSASAQSGYATPGYINSNARPESYINDNAVVIEPEIFSPQLTGQDFSKINYHFDQSGFIANIKIVDTQGRLMKTVANNETLSLEGFFRWDGDRDDGTQARMGYYVVWFEVFNTEGTVQTYRKRVVVAGRN